MYSSLDRGVRLLGFAIVLTGATAELFSTFLVLLVDILLSVLLCSLAVGKPVWQLDSQGYAFERSLQDIALLSVARGVLLSVARGWDRCHPFARAYLWTSYIAFGACAPALITKAVLFQYTGSPRHRVLQGLALFAALVWAAVAVAVARAHVARDAKLCNLGDPRRRVHSSSWASLISDRESSSSRPASASLDPSSQSAPLLAPVAVAIQESGAQMCNALCNGYQLAYALYTPESAAPLPPRAVVLIHGAAPGGAFSFRLLGQELADGCKCCVIAVDRPTHGDSAAAQPTESHSTPALRSDLSSQAVPDPASTAPCSLPQPTAAPPAAVPACAAGEDAALLLALLRQLSIRDAVLVGHGDGAAIALYAHCLAAAQQLGAQQLGLSEETSDAGRGSGPAGGASTSDARQEGAPASPFSAVAPGHQQANDTCVVDLRAPAWYTPHKQPPDPGHSSPPAEVSSAPGVGAHAVGGSGAQVRVCGVALLHPCLQNEGKARSGGMVGLLSTSRAGRRLLRSLLRAEVGDVFNRLAWHDKAKLTPAVRALYAQQLQTRGWDRALVAAAHDRGDGAAVACWRALARRQGAGEAIMVATGVQDVIVAPAKAARLAAELGAPLPVLLPECGHLSHEEAPERLVRHLVAFARNAFCGNRLLGVK